MPSYPECPANIEPHYFEVCESFFGLLSQLNQDTSQSLDHGELEEWIHIEGMELQRQLVQAYLNQRSANEPRHEKQIGADGMARTHRRADCPRALETRFGEVSVPRMGYGGR